MGLQKMSALAPTYHNTPLPDAYGKRMFIQATILTPQVYPNATSWAGKRSVCSSPRMHPAIFVATRTHIAIYRKEVPTMKRTMNSLNTDLTLRELLTLTSPTSVTPPASLKEQHPVAVYSTPTFRVRVYKNGFALAEDGIRSAVIRVDDRKMYDFDPDRTADNNRRKERGKQRDLRSDLDFAYFLDQPWTVRMALLAFDELEKLADEETQVSKDTMSCSGHGVAEAYTESYTESFEDDLLDRLEQETIVDQLMTRLTERERTVITYRFWKQMTLEEVAHQLNLSRGRVQQIEAKALRSLRMYAKCADLRVMM